MDPTLEHSEIVFHLLRAVQRLPNVIPIQFTCDSHTVTLGNYLYLLRMGLMLFPHSLPAIPTL